MKKVYFVRHGETLMNRKGIHQSAQEPLTAKGKTQAQAVALQLKEKKVDTLVSSPFTRARETAVIIEKEIDIPIIFSESVIEFQRPHALYGKPHYSLDSLWYALQLFVHRENPQWDNDGAENMFSIRNRILDTKKEICSLEGSVIVVVSHSIFMHMFAQAMCADRPLKFSEFVSGMMGGKKVPNTGIIAFDVDETAPHETCNWWLVKEETDPQYLQLR